MSSRTGGSDCWSRLPILIVVLAGIVGLGQLVTALARLLLGPSPAQRLAALQERNEQLLERTRIARELHDSIGHALTIAVMQAGAARAANDPAFTDRALCAIEDTGRAALEDLDRVLGVLRESAGPASQRPTLAEADRLLDSARSSGARSTAEVSGGLEQIPVAVSQEGYRILQEALTNALAALRTGAGPRPDRRHRSAPRHGSDESADRADDPSGRRWNRSSRHPRTRGAAWRSRLRRVRAGSALDSVRPDSRCSRAQLP